MLLEAVPKQTPKTHQKRRHRILEKRVQNASKYPRQINIRETRKTS
jgi:ribosomal protein S30